MYLNNEVLSLDDLERGDAARLDRVLARVRAIRQIGGKIIDLLAQFEDFQKQLWLKKKFVLETNWCVTLDRLPVDLYPEIAANPAQCEEWVELFAVDEIHGDLANGNMSWSNPPSLDFLKANPYLVLDTKHFDRDFIDRLLVALSKAGPLEEQMDGLLVHGENFQALNLLQTRYHSQVQSAYLDPPYNTDASSIMYKNGYKDSSWISMMEDRLDLVSSMLKGDGIACVAIDDEEVSVLRTILKNNFDIELGVVTVRSNPAGRKTKGRFAPAHEYALFYGKTDQASPAPLKKSDIQNKSYPQEDERGRFMWTNLVRSGTNDRREDRPRQFYPVVVNEVNMIRIPKIDWDEASRSWIILEPLDDDEIVIYPYRKISGTTVEGNWQRGHSRLIEDPKEYRARRLASGEVVIDFKKRMDENALPKTWWDDSKYSSANGTMQLSALFGDRVFDFPKSVDLVKDCMVASIPNSSVDSSVIDFFAGSGTTGHAAINFNRENHGRIRYILVEAADYFDTVMLPRLKKVIYSQDWNDGKPVSCQGSSQFLKLIRLECYEDSLDNLEVTEQSKAQGDLFAGNTELAEDYHLRYVLGVKTAGSACLLGDRFKDPFSYTLSIVRDGIRNEVKVDLPETFNYLIGLSLESRQWLDGVLVITGKDVEGRTCSILWCNRDEIDYAALDAWLLRNRTRLPEQLDLIYANGDHTLNAVRQPQESWIAETIEPIFRKLIFGATE